ncbi:hypothetical protein J2S19_004189 [Metabacillus malikii]|uniref:Uncharacterized protein n=1 Tax=Metabacillus malikii TaxID=1504265 RepID=A0ABT9ZM42_9BACI|nr:hypothetical protein [Metabacillus malikii]
MDGRIEYCPYCNVSLQCEPLPKELRNIMVMLLTAQEKFAISSLEEDRVTKWECPDCHKQWDRIK